MSARKGHHGHAYCGGLCVPGWLHESFEEQLGPKAPDMDLLAWYPKRDAARRLEGVVIEDPLTWWREAFIAEIRFRGWSSPAKPRPRPDAPFPSERLAKMAATFGRSPAEQRRQLQEVLDYRMRRAKS